MPFVFLLLLALVCIQGSWAWPESPLGFAPVEGAWLTWLGTVCFCGLGWALARYFRRQIQGQAAERAQILARFSTLRRYYIYGFMAYFVAALYLLGWGRLAASTLPGRELVLLGPFLVAMIFAWTVFYNVDRASHESIRGPGEPPYMGRWAYIGLQVRHNFLLIIPPLILLFLEEIVFALFPELQQDDSNIVSGFVGVLVLGVFVGLPWLLRLLLGLKPLPAGDLRDRLEIAARRLRFRHANILLWNTRHTVANAMVTGSVPWLRYVVLTDKLVDDLTPDEVEAVFGHEVGHIKHHHMIFYLGFLFVSLAVLTGCLEFAESFLRNLSGMKYWAALPILAVLAGYIFFVFGFISRRCERQADIFGCRATNCDTFISALEKVARINGIPREKPGWLSSWQHSTIARRVDFIKRMSADPEVEPRFQRRVRVVKWSVVLGLVAVLGLMWFFMDSNQAAALLK
jgi:STE24 endopeptidase